MHTAILGRLSYLFISVVPISFREHKYSKFQGKYMYAY